MNWTAFDPAILLPAFAAGLLVLSTHLPLGREVLARGIIFIDLAIAQIAGLGVIFADLLGWPAHGWVVQVLAAASALAGAGLLHWADRRWPEVQEALIGVTFVLAATGGLLLLAGNPHGGEHLKELLAGQILWVNWGQLLPVGLLYVVLLVLRYGFGARRGGLRFYLIFALAVTASVQLVGVYLVFTSLIVPALAVSSLRPAQALPAGFLIGGGGYALGLAASALFDLPSGPAIVWALVMVALSGGWLAKRLAPPLSG